MYVYVSRSVYVCVMYFYLQGKRTVGGQRKCVKDSLKVPLKGFNISHESWQTVTSNKGANTVEECRFLQEERKCEVERPVSNTPHTNFFFQLEEADSLLELTS